VSIPLEFTTEIGGPSVLPHNGALERVAVFSVEADRCFSLVGDPESEHVVPLARDSGSHFREGTKGEFGDLQGVVFDLAGGGKILG